MKIIAVISFLAFSLTLTLSTIRETINCDLSFQLAGPLLATREFDLAQSATGTRNITGKTDPRWALLLIDSNKEISQAHIDINGHRIREAPQSIYQFYQRKFDLLSFLEELATDLKIYPEDVRQWRAVPVPIDYLNLEGKNKISVAAPVSAPLTIYGDYQGKDLRFLPTYEYISHSRIFVDADCKDWRPRTKFLTPCPCRSFIESNEAKYPLPANPDLSAAPGIQKGHWRFYVALGFDNASNNPSLKSEEKSVPLSSLNFIDQTTERKFDQIPTLGISKSSPAADSAKTARSDSLSFHTDCRADYELKAQKQATHLIVELTGKARPLSGTDSQAVVRVSLQSAKEGQPGHHEYDDGEYLFDSKGQPKPSSLCFPSAMQMLALKQGKATSIDIKAIYPLDAVRGRGEHLTIELLPVPEGTQVKLEEAKLSVRELAWPELGRGTVLIY